MSTINESGFVEFITTLINETIDAISIAQIEQEQKNLDLKKDLNLSKTELIEKYDLENKIEFPEDISTEEKDELLNTAVDNHRALMESYQENGFVKTIVEKGKLSTKFIFSFNNAQNNSQNGENPPQDTPNSSSSDSPEPRPSTPSQNLPGGGTINFPKGISKKKLGASNLKQKKEAKASNKVNMASQKFDMNKLKNMQKVKMNTSSEILRANNLKIPANITTQLTVTPVKKLNDQPDSSSSDIVTTLELEFRTVVE